MLSRMRPLVQLPLLESIEIWLAFRTGPWANEHPYFAPEREFLASDLGRELHRLQKVYVRIYLWNSAACYQYILWEKFGSWRLKKIDEYFTQKSLLGN